MVAEAAIKQRSKNTEGPTIVIGTLWDARTGGHTCEINNTQEKIYETLYYFWFYRTI